MNMRQTVIKKRKTLNHGFYTGFTFLEVMISISIISIVLISIYRLHSQTLMMNYSARFYTLAPLLAQVKLSEIDVMDQEDLSDDSGDFDEDYPGYSWKITIDDLILEDEESFSITMKQIEIKVMFNENELMYDLKVYRYADKE